MIKRFLAVLVAVSLLSFSVFCEEPFAPIFVTGNINFADYENGSGLPISTLGYFQASGVNNFFNWSASSSSVYGWSYTFSSSYSVARFGFYLSYLSGSYSLYPDQLYSIRFSLAYQDNGTQQLSFDRLDIFAGHVIYQTSNTVVFYVDNETSLNNLRIDAVLSTPVSFSSGQFVYVYYASLQTLTGFTKDSDSSDVKQAIDNQTAAMEDQWNKEDQAMAGGVNPGQSGVNDSISQGITDLDDFDNQIFADFDKYKSDLDFGLSAWSEAASGISYIGNIFMIIWDNSPNQVIVLSLMLGLCGLVLGRGARLSRAARRSDRGADDG